MRKIKSFVVWAVLTTATAVWATGEQVGPAVPAGPASSFEVATIKPVDPDHPESGRYLRMESANRFVAVNFSLKLLIAAAYDLNPRAITGGPGWVDATRFDIVARTPGETRPDRNEQMAMLRALLVDRFGLHFHREPKVMSIYALEIAKGGPKLKPSATAADAAAQVTSTVYPDHVLLPARNVTMGDFVAMLQRALLDRPVVDRTGLQGRYDFDLVWAPDETQFGGEAPKMADDATASPLFTAMPQQLGLRLEAMHGPVSTLVIDKAVEPAAE